MADPVTLKVRRSPTSAWINNHKFGGWKVRNSDNDGWIQMTVANTAVRNPDFNENLPISDSNPLWLKTK